MAAIGTPYEVCIDPEAARHLATTGCTLLLLGVPLGTLIGIDHQVYVVGPKFSGVKMVPPGVHFLSYQYLGSSSSSSMPAPAVGMFKELVSQQVLVLRWEPGLEGLRALQDEEEEGRYIVGVRRFDFDSQLAPYNLGLYHQWQQLSCHTTPQLLERLNPAGGEICVSAEALELARGGGAQQPTAAEARLLQQLQEGAGGGPSPQAQAEEQQQQQQQGASGGDAGGQSVSADGSGRDGAAAQGAKAMSFGRCHYTHIPRCSVPPGVTGAALSAANLDKTPLLEQLLAEAYQGQPGQLLGEMQYAFIAFLCAQSLEGFLQWKALVSLLLSCERGLLSSHQDLLTAALTTLSTQLQTALGTPPAAAPAAAAAFMPAGRDGGSGSLPLGVGLVEDLLADSFLRHQASGLVEVVREEQHRLPRPLLDQVHQLERVLHTGLGWDFRLTDLEAGDGDEDDEYGPVVVDLPEEVQQQLNL